MNRFALNQNYAIGFAPVFLLTLMLQFTPVAAEETETLDQLRVAIEEQQDLEEYAFDLPLIDHSANLSFSELAESGQPFVLFWWLTDCPLCHLQLPYVQQLQDQIDELELDLRVVTICVDEDPDDSADYLRENEITLTVLFDPRARRTDRNYQVKELGCPLTYVFDSGGDFVDYIKGFRSNIAKSVFELLEIELPTQHKLKRDE